MENPLRQWRKAKGLRAVDVANKLDVSERAVLAFETGGFKPSRETLVKLAALMEEKEERISMAFRFWRKEQR